MKRSPIKRKSPLKQGKPLNRTLLAKPVKRRGEVVSTFWRRDLGACAVCPAEGGVCRGPVQGHHVIARSTLRRRGHLAHLMDLRNRLPVCEHRHEQHTTRYRPIPRELLPASVFEFAAELGLERYLDERFYPSSRRAAA